MTYHHAFIKCLISVRSRCARFKVSVASHLLSLVMRMSLHVIISAEVLVIK